jgi:hypothetical protein
MKETAMDRIDADTRRSWRRFCTATLLAVVAAGAAAGDAETPEPPEPPADVNPGLRAAIASQGNAALLQIRAEATRLAMPQLPPREAATDAAVAGQEPPPAQVAVR